MTMLAMTLTIGAAQAQTGGRKILVAWYSWGGNTEAVGKIIQQLTGADVFVIEPVEPYSTDYRTCTEEAKAEINAGRTRAIKGNVPDIGQYDVVVVGTPNWWSTMAPPVLSFLNGHDLAGKTVVPFVTHGGGREARCFSDMERAVPDAEFLKGFVVPGNRANGCKAEVERWLKETGLIG